MDEVIVSCHISGGSNPLNPCLLTVLPSDFVVSQIIIMETCIFLFAKNKYIEIEA